MKTRKDIFKSDCLEKKFVSVAIAENRKPQPFRFTFTAAPQKNHFAESTE